VPENTDIAKPEFVVLDFRLQHPRVSIGDCVAKEQDEARRGAQDWIRVHVHAVFYGNGASALPES
jgi:hypothetical protein